MKPSKAKKAKKMSSVEGPVSSAKKLKRGTKRTPATRNSPRATAAQSPDLAAQVSELQRQLAALRAAVEGRETSIESQERIERPRSRASANPQSTPASSPVESSGYFTGPSHSLLHHAVAAEREGGPLPATAAQQPPSTLDSGPSTQLAALSEEIAALRNQLSTLDSRPSTRAAAKPLPIYELKETRPVGYQTSDLLASSSEESQDGFFTGLLDRARMQWLMGDWEALSKLDLEQIQHHPDRAKLALLASAGFMQSGEKEKSKHFLALAAGWGASNRFICSVLMSGLHLSLGIGACLAGKPQKGLKYLNNSQHSRLVPAGAGVSQKIGILGFETKSTPQFIPNTINYNSSDSNLRGAFTFESEKNTLLESLISSSNAYLQKNGIPSISKKLSEEQNASEVLLAEASVILQNSTNNTEFKNLDETILNKEDFKIRFFHIKDDYISLKIRNESKFYESDFLDFLAGFHFDGGFVIDVGANIGNHSLYFAQRHNAIVFSIEPEPNNYFCLSLNAIINKYRGKIYPLNVGCGKTNCTMILNQIIKNNYGSFKCEENKNFSPAIRNKIATEIPIYSLDSIFGNQFENGAIPSILKIDVEGMEENVLRGAKMLIEKFQPVIAAECQNNLEFKAVQDYLKNFGYYTFKCFNATPTFIFLSRNNLLHTRKSQSIFYKESLLFAIKKRGFICDVPVY